MLGVAKPSHTTMSILLSPVGPYFPTGLQPVSLFVDEHNRWGWREAPPVGPVAWVEQAALRSAQAEQDACWRRAPTSPPRLTSPAYMPACLRRRAWPGGAGDCKIGGNYAPTIMPQVGMC